MPIDRARQVKSEAERLRPLRMLVTGVGGGAVGAGLSWLVYRGLLNQAATARQRIPHRTDNAPNGDGIYERGHADPSPVTFRDCGDLHVMIFGDSTAAGLGVEYPSETPGSIIARSIAEETGRRVRLSTKAIVGATSKGLAGQVDAMLVRGCIPDIAVIVIGSNDITAQNSIWASADRLGNAVHRLRDVDVLTVVGTCPDIGAIRTIPQPLRAVMRRWGLMLAARQSSAVRAAGGIPVPLADLLAPDFLSAPERMLSSDNFHPSAAGYSLAAAMLLPDILTALGAWSGDEMPEPPRASDFEATRNWLSRFNRIVRWHPPQAGNSPVGVRSRLAASAADEAGVEDDQ